MKKRKDLDWILLVDDDESNNFLHKMIVKQAGLNVTIKVACNGLEALDFLNNRGKFSLEEKPTKPGMIFLDINMPSMNGWEFLEAFKKLPENQKSNIAMMLLTTSLDKVDLQRASSYMELKSFINKPLSISKLNEVIQKYFIV